MYYDRCITTIYIDLTILSLSLFCWVCSFLFSNWKYSYNIICSY